MKLKPEECYLRLSQEHDNVYYIYKILPESGKGNSYRCRCCRVSNCEMLAQYIDIAREDDNVKMAQAHKIDIDIYNQVEDRMKEMTQTSLRMVLTNSLGLFKGKVQTGDNFAFIDSVSRVIVIGNGIPKKAYTRSIHIEPNHIYLPNQEAEFEEIELQQFENGIKITKETYDAIETMLTRRFKSAMRLLNDAYRQAAP